MATLLLSAARAAGLKAHDSAGLHLAALALALTIITILHMTLGEQAANVFALHKPERLSLFVAFS